MLGIDPGTRVAGWGIVERNGHDLVLVDCGVIRASAEDPIASRLRVIFDNGTESAMLKRSVERALQKDEAGRRITDPTAGPLFSGESEDGEFFHRVIRAQSSVTAM